MGTSGFCPIRDERPFPSLEAVSPANQIFCIASMRDDDLAFSYCLSLKRQNVTKAKSEARGSLRVQELDEGGPR